MGGKRYPGLRGFDWRTAEDLTALSEGELRSGLAELAEEERAACYRLEVLRGRMDVIRVELVRREAAVPESLSSEELARVLLGEAGEAGGGRGS
jgi:hypothetical protein